MIKLFKGNNALGQIVAIAFITAALWLPVFWQGIAPHESDVFAPLYDLVIRGIAPYHTIANALALLLIVVQGIWLNILLYRYKMTSTQTLMPMMLYIVAMSASPAHIGLTPFVFVNLAILAACSQLLSAAASTLEVSRNFNASFCIGLATLFYLPALTYLIPFLLVFVIYKLYRWRHILVAFFGFIAPMILFFTYAFLFDKADYFSILIAYDLTSLHFVSQDVPTLISVPNIIILVILVASLTAAGGKRLDGGLQWRINTGILLLPLIAALAMHLYSAWFPFNLQSAAIPFAFSTTLLLMTDRKRRWINETIIWILLVACAIPWLADLTS